jgi:aminopeptidase N
MQTFQAFCNVFTKSEHEDDMIQEVTGQPCRMLAACLMGILIALSSACQPGKSALAPPTSIVGAEVGGLSTPTLAVSHVSARLPDDLTDDMSSIGDPYIPELGNKGYDVQHYTLQLALNPALGLMQGTTVIDAVVTAENLEQLSLDFVGFEIPEVTVNGITTSYSHEARKLWVDLPQPQAIGAPLTVVVAYRGTPTREASAYVGFTDALGLSFSSAETIYTLSEPDGARYWFPSNDHPRDKAFYRFELTIPAGLTAVANGRLVEIRSPGLQAIPGGGSGQTFVWDHSFPMATYLALVAVGPFERIETISPNGVPLRHYVTAAYRDEFEKAVAVTGAAIDWMSELFGPYPFEAFGYVATDLPPTAMETQTMVILSNDLIGQKTAVHELAHMWFGNWVGPDSWSEMWRKEGFATYVALMWETGDNPEALDSRMAEILAAVGQNEPQYPIGYPPPQHLLGYNTYFKGAVMIHALRRELGDDAFFAGVRAYLQRYGGATASDAQFQAVMEESAGRPLDAFFTEWLH